MTCVTIHEPSELRGARATSILRHVGGETITTPEPPLTHPRYHPVPTVAPPAPPAAGTHCASVDIYCRYGSVTSETSVVTGAVGKRHGMVHRRGCYARPSSTISAALNLDPFTRRVRLTLTRFDAVKNHILVGSNSGSVDSAALNLDPFTRPGYGLPPCDWCRWCHFDPVQSDENSRTKKCRRVGSDSGSVEILQ
ncbi:hypothetical protein B296_00047825 [Ensete ventricosum]|uniref:Uncharacterized protein n=1 Tax=Ensete ventricosum TaxID=4639 RepID=A0A426YER7_ENSVE|nr:hypothetical protein B296_00047825 [Ensete ventricosum]